MPAAGESLPGAEPADELETLMSGYQRADSEAAAALVARLSPPIFQYFLAQVRDRWKAEDLLQDFWLRIHKARRTYRPGEPVLPWAYAIARRVRVDGFRKSRRVLAHEVQAERLPEVTAAQADSKSAPELEQLLDSLPEAQRETIVMLKVSGLTLEEVARATGTTVGAVKQRAHRAYEKLRKAFGAEL